jgi:hypothetical protein
MRDAEDSFEFSTLVKMADAWATCPCGQLPQCVKRNHDGMPVDTELAYYGTQFSVKSHQLVEKTGLALIVVQEELIKLLRNIEMRGTVLARQEMAKQNELKISIKN